MCADLEQPLRLDDERRLAVRILDVGDAVDLRPCGQCLCSNAGKAGISA
jgi:hypothetical protein